MRSLPRGLGWKLVASRGNQLPPGFRAHVLRLGGALRRRSDRHSRLCASALRLLCPVTCAEVEVRSLRRRQLSRVTAANSAPPSISTAILSSPLSFTAVPISGLLRRRLCPAKPLHSCYRPPRACERSKRKHRGGLGYRVHRRLSLCGAAICEATAARATRGGSLKTACSARQRREAAPASPQP